MPAQGVFQSRGGHNSPDQSGADHSPGGTRRLTWQHAAAAPMPAGSFVDLIYGKFVAERCQNLLNCLGKLKAFSGRSSRKFSANRAFR
jgi:hypothetical protein